MKKLIRLWVTTVIIAIVTIAFLIYGYIYDDSTIFFIGDLIGIPCLTVCYVVYKEEYNGYVRNVRHFK